MIDDMLIYAAEQGASPYDIKQMIINVLQPYFAHPDILNKYACDGILLSSFEFFIRYNYDMVFSQEVKTITDCYKNANIKFNQKSWDVILSTYSIMIEDENKMWSIKKNKINLQEDDIYEKMVRIFQFIGNCLEVSVKHILQELYALIHLLNKGNVDYDKIRKQDFGVIINNILDKGMLQSVLLVGPCDMKLSDWRNIACHHTYSLDSNGDINCTYGKGNSNQIKISMQELEEYLHKLIRSSNILNISRSIFLFDFIDDIPIEAQSENVSLRQSIIVEQFRISLLSQEFQLGKITLDDNKVELDFHDLSLNCNQKNRIIHCSQLLLNTWNIWERNQIYINYFDNINKKICCVYVDGEVCKDIYEGKKEISYLAEQFQIRYF